MKRSAIRARVTAMVRLGAAALVLSWATATAANPLVDCPLRDAPFSVDSPVVDLLLNLDARTVLEKHWPGLRTLPAMFTSTTPPTFGAIMSVRAAAASGRAGSLPVEQIDRELSAIPVTDADRRVRCARYDTELPRIAIPRGRPRLLVFEKINGFRDSPSIAAAAAAFRTLAARNGWSLTFTDKGGAMTPAFLKQFDAVIWNNVSGDVLTLAQRAAFRSYIEQGGGYVGVHGSAGDPVGYWDWYLDTLVGARFAGHPMSPQFQDARIVVENPSDPIVKGLGSGWSMNDEWYSFTNNPRASGATVLATLDEGSYQPGKLAMGDHPIVWSRCVGRGRSFYSAIGHRPETYAEPHHVKLLEQATIWAAGGGKSGCTAGKVGSGRR